MLAGEFGQGLAMPFGILPLLATMIGCGIWTEQLGGQQARRVPVAYLIGIFAGAVVPVIPSLLPIADIIMPVSAVVLGLLIATAVRVPPSLAMVVVLVVGLAIGYCFLGGSVFTPLRWLGLFCGVVVAVASGIGLSILLSISVARILGLGVAVLGIWMLIEGM
ncbi:MAG: HupE/UreJ family protein [Pseudomonadota bacterium]